MEIQHAVFWLLPFPASDGQEPIVEYSGADGRKSPLNDFRNSGNTHHLVVGQAETMVSTHLPPSVASQAADLQTLLVEVYPRLGIVHVLVVLRKAT